MKVVYLTIEKDQKKMAQENRNIYPEQIGPQEKYQYTPMYDPEHILNLPDSSPNTPIAHDALRTQYLDDLNLYSQASSNKKRKLDECYSNTKIEYSVHDPEPVIIGEYMLPISSNELPTQFITQDPYKSNNMSQFMGAFDHSGISTTYSYYQ